MLVLLALRIITSSKVVSVTPSEIRFTMASQHFQDFFVAVKKVVNAVLGKDSSLYIIGDVPSFIGGKIILPAAACIVFFKLLDLRLEVAIFLDCFLKGTLSLQYMVIDFLHLAYMVVFFIHGEALCVYQIIMR